MSVAPLHCTALHCTALHCTALHCTASHNNNNNNNNQSPKWPIRILTKHTFLCYPCLSALHFSQGLSCCQFHPDGLIFGTGTFDHKVHVWNIAQQAKVATFEHGEGEVTSLAFSENGYYLATATNNAMVKLWDLRKGDFTPFQVLEFEAGYTPQTLSFDYSGAYLAVGGNDVRVYATKGYFVPTVYANSDVCCMYVGV